MAYDIARYFSPEARRSAAAARYSPAPGATHRRTRDGLCPLGALLQADGYGERYHCPDSAYAASAIADRLEPAEDKRAGLARFTRIRTATAAFIADWDSGAIRDLADALECPAPMPKPPEFGGGDAERSHNPTGAKTAGSAAGIEAGQ